MARTHDHERVSICTAEEKDLGPRLASDAERMNRERARKGLPGR